MAVIEGYPFLAEQFENQSHGDLFAPSGKNSYKAAASDVIDLDRYNSNDVIWDKTMYTSMYDDGIIFDDSFLADYFLTIYNFDPDLDKIYSDIDWGRVYAVQDGSDTFVGKKNTLCLSNCQLIDYLYVFKDVIPEDIDFSWNPLSGLFETNRYSGPNIAINSDDYSEQELDDLYKDSYAQPSPSPTPTPTPSPSPIPTPDTNTDDYYYEDDSDYDDDYEDDSDYDDDGSNVIVIDNVDNSSDATPTPTPTISDRTYVEKDGDTHLLIDANGLYYAQNSNGSGTFDVLKPNGTQYKKSKQWRLLALENINGINTGLWKFKNKSYSTWEYNDNWKEIKDSEANVKGSEAKSFGQDSLAPQNDQEGNSSGMNIIEGDNKKNKLKGSNGSDKIFGYEGADKIDGKKGDDIINSGLWKKGKYDVVKGGSGSDTFILKDGYWAYIKDFKIFEDKLDLSGISGDFSWDYWKKYRLTYIYDNKGDEVARIKGSVDIDSADLIM